MRFFCSFIFVMLGLVSAHPAVSADSSAAAAAEKLPEAGYCPVSVTNPDCQAKLDAYAAAYRDLVKASDAYHKTLGDTFFAKFWTTSVSSQSHAFSAGVTQLATKLAGLQGRLDQAEIKKFVGASLEVETARKAYEDERNAWTNDPFKVPNELDVKHKDYHAKLRTAYELADGFPGKAEELSALRQEADAISTELNKLREMLAAADGLAASAMGMRETVVAHAGPVDAAYQVAKSAGGQAVLAGAELKKKPPAPAADAAGGNVVIVDAIYGDARMLQQAENEIVGRKDTERAIEEFIQIVEDRAGPFNQSRATSWCSAKGYVQDRCSFDNAVIKICLNEKVLTDPSTDPPAGICNGTDFKSQIATRVVPVRNNQHACSMTVSEAFCNGAPPIVKPERERAALVVYRCGEKGPWRVKRVAHDQVLNLSCQS